MVKQSSLLSIIILTVALLAAGCGSTKAASPTTTAIPVTVTTTQFPSPSTSAAPTTSILQSTTTAITQPVTSIPTTTTPPATSVTTTTMAVYIIHATAGGVDALDQQVKVGTTVRWTPLGHEDRTLVSDIPGLFGGLLTTNPYVEYTFNQVGTFYYHFEELPGFKTSIIVIP